MRRRVCTERQRRALTRDGRGHPPQAVRLNGAPQYQPVGGAVASDTPQQPPDAPPPVVWPAGLRTQRTSRTRPSRPSSPSPPPGPGPRSPRRERPSPAFPAGTTTKTLHHHHQLPSPVFFFRFLLPPAPSCSLLPPVPPPGRDPCARRGHHRATNGAPDQALQPARGAGAGPRRLWARALRARQGLGPRVRPQGWCSGAARRGGGGGGGHMQRGRKRESVCEGGLRHSNVCC